MSHLYSNLEYTLLYFCDWESWMSDCVFSLLAAEGVHWWHRRFYQHSAGTSTYPLLLIQVISTQ
jgi:hypothetical protein